MHANTDNGRAAEARLRGDDAESRGASQAGPKRDNSQSCGARSVFRASWEDKMRVNECVKAELRSWKRPIPYIYSSHYTQKASIPFTSPGSIPRLPLPLLFPLCNTLEFAGITKDIVGSLPQRWLLLFL